MRIVSAIHRWCGAFIGLLLALLGLSGTILVWEGAWVRLPGARDRVLGDVGAIGTITHAAVGRRPVDSVTFASEEIGLHQIAYVDGSGAYVRQDGTLVERWASQWERPELWLFDLHHHLFAGETGETVTGIAGLAGLLFVVTGTVLWWRSRRSFAPRFLPKRLTPSAIVSHHRDLGVIAAPLLMLSMLTGALMLFQPMRNAALGKEQRPATTISLAPAQDIASALATAAALFPQAELRRVTFPTDPREPIAIRLRQPFEWTPNGRTFVRIAPDGTASVEDPAAANRSAAVAEKLYPIHSAKSGGFLWKAVMTASGLALTLLGSLTTVSFWARRLKRAKSQPPRSPLKHA